MQRWCLRFILFILSPLFFDPVKAFKPFYFPLARESDLGPLQRVFLGDDPLVVYPSENLNKYIVQSDVCPHMGAQLHKGWRSVHGGIHCPYHAFEFSENGVFCNIPNPILSKNKKRPQNSRIGKVCLDTYPVHLKYGYLFIPSSVHEPVYRPGSVIRKMGTKSNGNDIRLDVPFRPFFPPENKDPQFRMTEGSIEIPQYQDIITENLLDMLHISYVHSFGSRLTPIPYEVQHHRLHDWGFRTRFLYSPNQNTISTEMGRVTTVVVENEFYMPSTTITRVIAGNIVKTVHTFTTPRQGKSSTLYWRIYRNFWVHPQLVIVDMLGDFLIRVLMNRTLEEDRSILEKIYEDRRDSKILTRYDISIKKYREMVERFSQPFDEDSDEEGGGI